ncbi:MAG: hemolysin family protein [Bacteroidales bacterium]
MSDWTIIIITVIFSAFFSGMEIAFVSSNKLKVELDRNKGRLSGSILSSFVQNPSRFIGALLLGNNVALVVYGLAATRILKPFLLELLPLNLHSEILILVLQTVVSTFFILLFAEFTPKILFRMNSNGVLSFFAVPIALLYYVTYPVIFLFTRVAEILVKWFLKTDVTDQKYAFGVIDLSDYVNELSQNEEEGINKEEIQMVQNAIEFKSTKVRECLIPRTEIVAHEINDEIEELKQSFMSSGHSKILIYDDTIDNIIGYTHSYDMFRMPKKISEILRTIDIFSETTLANTAMKHLLAHQKSLAVVVDEYGGTSGIVSVEDLMEEIFGEIHDEYDKNHILEKQISKNEFLFSARMEIDRINEQYKIELPVSDDYETLGGLVLTAMGDIPEEGEVLQLEGYKLIITKASDRRIEEVRIICKE